MIVRLKCNKLVTIYDLPMNFTNGEPKAAF